MARLTQAQVEQWIAANGGPGAVQYGVEQKQVKNTDLASPDAYTSIEVETWKNSKTGAVLSAKRTDEGDYDLYETSNADPNKPAAGLPPARTPEQQRSDAATATVNETKAQEVAREEAERKNNRELPPDQDPRDETNAQRAARADATVKEQDSTARQAQQDAEAKAERDRQAQRQATADAQAAADRNKPGVPVLKPDGKGGTIAVQVMPDGSIQTTPLPGVPSDKPAPRQVTVNGVVYEAGSDGKYAPAVGLPSEGAASASDRSMPDFVHEGASAALKRGWEMLQRDPTLTPEQRAKSFQEMVQAANVTTQQAQTEQRERESQRNADYNTATTKLGAMQTGLGQALDFANNVIKGGSGSQSAGAMFSALLGLQMLQMDRSGINDLKPAGSSTTLPVITPADLRDKDRLSAKTAEIGNQITATKATPIFTPAPPVGASTTPGAPAAPPMTTGGTGAPAISPAQASANAGPVPGQDGGIWYPPAPVMDAQAAADAGPVPGQDGSVWTPPPAVPETPAAPDYGAPGMNVLPQPGQMPIDATGAGGMVQKTMGPQANDFAALSRFLPPTPAQPQQAAPGGGEPPVAMLRAKVASVPPWQLSNEELAWAEQNGFLDDAMAIPGRRMA